MEKEHTLSEGPCADVRNDLVAKIKDIESGMKEWRELFVALLEIYPWFAQISHNIVKFICIHMTPLDL